MLVGPIFFELRLLFYPDIIDVCEKRQFLRERQCFRISPLHVMFKIHVLHVYVSGGERESVYPTSFALFMTPVCRQKKKGPLDHMISMEDTKGSFMFLLHVCTDFYYFER